MAKYVSAASDYCSIIGKNGTECKAAVCNLTNITGDACNAY